MPSINKIKEITKLHQKKHRDEQGLFIVEGLKAVTELIEAEIEVIDIFAIKDFNLPKKITIIDEKTMKKIMTTTSLCEILAVAKKRKVNVEEIKDSKKIVLLDSISDPGNLGTIIRSAAAFDIKAIILYKDCVDMYSSKVIRSTAGNLFKLPIVQVKTKEELEKIFPSHKKIATCLAKENNISLKECSKIDKYIVMMGSEAKGLSNELINIADKNIKLDMTNNVESLNLSVSASIIFYELFSNCNNL